MSMYNWMVRNILARVLDYSSGTRTMACLSDLEKSQWWPRDRILELQNERLQQLIKHAYDNVPYYRRIFDERALKPGDIGCSTDLRKLPVLDKRTIRHNFDSIKSLDFLARKPVLLSTGGSTGEPLLFYSIKDEELNWGYARALRARSWAGYQMGDRIAAFRLRLPNETVSDKIARGAKRPFRRSILFEPMIMSDETMPRVVKNLEAFSPKFIGGYPSAIYLLARYLKSHDMPNLELEATVTGSEQLHDHQRELFYEVFRCEVYSHYSSWEVHDIAAECPHHTGYHIAAESVIVEIADGDGNPLPVGVEGRILLTNLHNFAMPFIRYDIGDSGALADVFCPCGRGGLPLLVKLSGRADAIILTKSGRSIPGRALPQKFLVQWGVEQYQIVQENYEKVVIRLVLDKEYTREHKEQVIQEINAQYGPIFGTEIDIEVQFVEQIALAKSGKRDVVISKLSPDSR